MIYLQDTFQGTGPLSAHVSDSGATWTANAGDYTLDGNGYVFANTNNPPQAFPSTGNPPTTNFQVYADVDYLTALSAGRAGLNLLANGSNAYQFIVNNGGSKTCFCLNGVASGNSGAVQPAGSLWRYLLTIQLAGGGISLVALYSVSPYTTWTQIASTTIASATGWSPNVGLWNPGTNPTQATGWHIGNLIVEDIPPAATIGSSYVACSGQSLVFFPVASLGGATLNATAINTMPTVSINGGTPFQPVNYWCPPSGTSECILIALPAPYQVNPGDVVSVTAPSGWLSTSGGATGALSIPNMVNAVGAMPPPVASVNPTFKPGFNITNSHQAGGHSNLLRNRRTSASWANGVQTYDSGGGPVSLASKNANAYLIYPGNGTGLPGDNTGLPGVPGPYGVIWDDGAYGTANQCNISLSSPVGTLSTVSKVSAFTNAGSGGTGQAAVYLVSKAAGTTSAICPVQMTWTMPSWNSTTNKYPAVSNCYVILPRDLITRYTDTITVANGSTSISFATSQSGLTGLTLWVEGDATNGLYQIASGSGTSWTLATAYGGASGTFKNLYWGTLPNGPISIDRSQPYQLSRYFTDLFPSGVGTLRWMNTTVGQAAVNQMSQRWETHQLGEFTYGYAGGQVNRTITPTSGQPLVLANSPYFYGVNLGSPWLSAATVGNLAGLSALAAGTTDTLTLSSATAATDPIMYGLVLGLNVGGPNQEFVTVMGVGADNQTLSIMRGACNYSNLTSSPLDTGSLPPATAPAHSAGEPITIYCRKPWTHLSQFGGVNTQTAEFVTSGNHNIVAGVYYNFSGNATNMLDTEGNPFEFIYQFGAWPTAPNRFVLFGLNGQSKTGPTLAGVYSNTSNLKLTISSPPAGYPWEIPGMVGDSPLLRHPLLRAALGL